MIQLVEVLASKSDGWSPVSGTLREGESQFYKLSSGLHLHTKIHVCAHRHTHLIEIKCKVEKNHVCAL